MPFADVDEAIRAIQADPSNLEAARALLANLSPTAAASVLQLVSKSGVLPPPMMSALSTFTNPSSSTSSSSQSHPRVQNQLSELLGQLASMDPKGSVLFRPKYYVKSSSSSYEQQQQNNRFYCGL
ncbi:unnamed protein product [Gongylonema pulchrum]|uniref:CUE domain-containing protein n=1 Tax=Gongylonema pulchrum TaxID=637853 RepID=A0A183EDH3_9BILA|nr:unnamed protein product [Gongylonema pulchrum]